MKRIVVQYHASRRVVTIVWIESVCSLRYQPMNVKARAMENPMVVVLRLTPWPSTRLSVISVPAMEMSTTTSQ